MNNNKQLIKCDINTDLINQLTNEELAINYAIISKYLETDIKPLIKSRLINCGEQKIRFEIEGVAFNMTITKGQETIKEVINSEYNDKKIVAYANENGHKLPTKIDYESLEALQWFIDKKDSLVKKSIVKKTTKSNDAIRISGEK